MTWGFKGIFKRVLEFPGAAAQSQPAPPGRMRLRYNDVGDTGEISTNGGAYLPIGTAVTSPWVRVGTTIRPVVITDTVVIGAAAMVGPERLRVVGDIRVDSTVFVNDISTSLGDLGVTSQSGRVEVTVGGVAADAFSVGDGIGPMFAIDLSGGDRGVSLGGLAVDSINLNADRTDITVGVDASAMQIEDGVVTYFNLDTTLGAENMTIGGNVNIPSRLDFDSASLTLGVPDNSATALQLLQGLNSYINLSTVNGTESIRLGGAASTTLGAEVNVGVGSLTLGVPDNSPTSFQLLQGVNPYVLIDTTNGAESVSIGNSLSSTSVAVKDNSSLAFQILEGANNQLAVNTNDGTESLVLGNTTTNPDIIFDTDGDVTFPSTAICLFELPADPGAVANAVKLYAVDDGGSVLRVLFDDGDITQLSGNALSFGGAEVINRSGTAVQVGAGTDDSIFLANSNGAVALLTTGFTVITNGAGTGFTWSSLSFSIPERVGDPGGVANVGKLYTKDVAGVTELFYQKSDGTVVPLS